MNQEEIIKKCREQGLTEEQVKNCLSYYEWSKDFQWSFEKAQQNFNPDQMVEARSAFENGLSVEQIKTFYKPEFNRMQMREARLAFENGLSIEQVEFFYKPEFNWYQMLEASLAFENGLSIEQVETFYKPEFDWEQMKQARLNLQNENTENSKKSSGSTKSMSSF